MYCVIVCLNAFSEPNKILELFELIVSGTREDGLQPLQGPLGRINYFTLLLLY